VSAGLVFTLERNEVTNLGRPFIQTASVSGQGQSGNFAQRLLPGQPIGAFWGVEYAGLNAQGKQLFRCARTDADCANGVTTSGTNPADQKIIGNANPDFSLGFRSNARLGRFDASWLWRAEVGRDVFNNTALVYSTTANALQGRNFLRSALARATRSASRRSTRPLDRERARSSACRT
jgi:iron complex outermembrane receptor protein